MIEQLTGGPDHSPRPPTSRARVVRAPADFNSDLEVSLINYSALSTYEVPHTNWTPRGNVLPALGDECLLTFDDHGDAWVQVGNQYAATIAESDVTGLVADLAARELTASKGAADGYAPLDSDSKVPMVNLPGTVLRVGTDGAVGENGFINNGGNWNPIYVGNTTRPILELPITAGATDETWLIDGQTIVNPNSANWTRILLRYRVTDGVGGAILTTGNTGNTQTHSSLDNGAWVGLTGACYPLVVPAGATRKVRMEVVGATWGGSFYTGEWYTHIRGIRQS